ncbi:MAG: winged helix-turn-helix domain-containing tetratricopeptide repeat protein, partial [Blastocatellia bacterium]
MTKPAKHFYDFGPFRLDAVKRVLLREGEMVQMPPKVFDILLVLVEHGGELVEKGELMQRVWPDSFVEEGNLPVNIFALRKALGDEGDQYIKTVPKRGYLFVAKVTERWDEQPEAKRPAPESEFAALLSPFDYQPEIELPLAALPVESLSHTAARPDELQAFVQRQEATFERPALAALDQPVMVERGRKLYQPAIILSILLLGLAALVYFWTTRQQQSPVAMGKARSVAVLPFKVVSAEAGDEYLGPGLAAAIVATLTNLKQITVTPIASTIKYAGESQDPIEAGRALQVDAVLEGSIRKTGDSLRLTAQLVRVADGARLWELKSAEETANILAVQQVIPEQVARALELNLTSEEQAALAKRPTSSLEAYHCYLKGQYFGSQMTVKEVGQAVACFEQAVKADPNYAQAYAGLAAFLTLRLNQAPTMEKMVKAKAAATRALELDASLAEAHNALGRVMTFCDWDWTGAEKEYKRAIELNPNYAEAHFWYANYLSGLARHEEALAEIKLAQEIDPSSPRVNYYVGVILLMARRYDEAIEQFRKTPLDLGAINHQVYLSLGLAYAKKSRSQEAFAAFQKALIRSGNRPQAKAYLAHAYAQSGQRAEAEKILAELNEPVEGPGTFFIVLAGT